MTQGHVGGDGVRQWHGMHPGFLLENNICKILSGRGWQQEQRYFNLAAVTEITILMHSF